MIPKITIASMDYAAIHKMQHTCTVNTSHAPFIHLSVLATLLHLKTPNSS